MSIHAAFSAKARKKEGLINAVRKQASDQGLEVQEGEEGLWISFCPLGGISMEWKHEGGLLGQWIVSGERFSIPAGPLFCMEPAGTGCRL